MDTKKTFRQFRSLNYKLALVYGITATCGVTLILGLGYLGFLQSIYQSSEKRIGTLADSIVYSASLLTDQQSTFPLQRLMEKSATLEDVAFVAVTDLHGVIIAHSDHSLIGQKIESPLVTGAIQNQISQEKIVNNHISFVLPLHGQSYDSEYHDVIGVLWVEMNLQTALENARQLFLPVLLVSIFLLFFIYPLFYFATQKIIITRLSKLEVGLRRVEKGDLTTQINVPNSLGSEDEINALVQNFNKMTVSLYQDQHDIQHQRDFALLVMNSMGQGLIILDADGKIEYSNPAFERLLYYPSDYYDEKTLNDFILEGNTQKSNKSKIMPSQEQNTTFECKFTRSDGEQVHALVSATPRLEKGLVTGTIVVITDLTERAFLEQMKSDFVNRASHELRTPLSIAILMIDLLNSEMENSDQKEFWEALKESISRQHELVESLLILGRIEQGDYQIASSPTDLTQIINGSINAVQQQLRMNHLTIQFDYEENLPMVHGNEQALNEVMSNLLSNAIKFSKEEGVINIKAYDISGGITLTIADQGIGISSEDLPHLFTRFFRAQNATENEIQGNGLGLYIVKTNIEKLGGMISVESELNRGARFTIFLPEWKEGVPNHSLS
ncbi:MAG: ATP-binding protein [Chloroflexota bacterium]